MHYAVLVIANEPTEDAVEEILKPFFEREWNWFSIGGRWTGQFDGYDPEKDPANIETCDLCKGTGTRIGGKEQFGEAWAKSCNGCNGCQGKGTRVKWPTKWVKHDGDIKPASELTEKDLEAFYAFCTDYGWHGGEEWLPWREKDSFRKRDRPTLEWLKQRGKFAVVVDCHN